MGKKVAPKVAPPRFKGTKRPTFIRQWRKYRNKMTLEVLADRAGMSVGNLSQIETGEYEYNQGALEAIADALDCEPGDLIMRDPFASEPLWSVWDRIRPEFREQAIKVLKTFADEDEAAA